MVERKYAGVTTSDWYKANSGKWMQQYAQLQRLKVNRPDLYEKSLQALVDWIGTHAGDTEVSRRWMQERAARASKTGER